MIRQAIKRNKMIIVVVGCLVQNKDIKIDDVDIIIGNKNKNKIAQYIEEYIKINKNRRCDLKTSFENMQVVLIKQDLLRFKMVVIIIVRIVLFHMSEVIFVVRILYYWRSNELVKKGHQEIV